MAIIGPRPLLVRYLARYNEEQHHRHDVSSSEKQIIEGGEVHGKKGYHHKRVHGGHRGFCGCVQPYDLQRRNMYMST